MRVVVMPKQPMCLNTGRPGRAKYACLHLLKTAARSARMALQDKDILWLTAWLPVVCLASVKRQTGRDCRGCEAHHVALCGRAGTGCRSVLHVCRGVLAHARKQGAVPVASQHVAQLHRMTSTSACCDSNAAVAWQRTLSKRHSIHLFEMLVNWQVQSSPGLTNVWAPGQCEGGVPYL